MAAWADWVFLGSQTGQTVAGVVLALGGFAASNALQRRRMLAGGWASLGGAIALLVGLSSQTWTVGAGGALGLIGIGLIGVEFARRLGRQSARRR